MQFWGMIRVWIFLVIRKLLQTTQVTCFGCWQILISMSRVFKNELEQNRCLLFWTDQGNLRDIYLIIYLCKRKCSKCFTCIYSLNTLLKLMKLYLVSSAFYNWGNLHKVRVTKKLAELRNWNPASLVLKTIFF